MSEKTYLSSTVSEEIVKWESAFYAVHGRVPNKKDVDLAPGHLRKSYAQYCATTRADTDNPSLKRQRSFRLKRDEFDFHIKRKVARHAPDSPPFLNHTSASTPSSNKERSFQLNDDQFESRLLDEVKVDDSKHYYALEPLKKLYPKINKLSLLQPNWLDELLSRDQCTTGGYTNLPEEVDLSKRKKMCDFVIANSIDNAEDDVPNHDCDDPRPHLKTDDDIDGEDYCTFDGEQHFMESAKLIEYSRRRKGKIRSNENFTKINLKQKRYAPISSAVRKLKGAALKRFLYKMRTSKKS